MTHTCKICNVELKDVHVYDRHMQYGHDVDKGLPVCATTNCKVRPYLKNKKCKRHMTGSTINVLSIPDCKKIKRQTKIMKIAKPNALTSMMASLEIK